MVSAVACYALYGAALAAGVDFIGPFSGPGAPAGPLPVPAILLSNLVPGLLASFVFWGMSKALSAPRMPFIILSVVLAAASMAPPLMLAGTSLGTRLALAAMHVFAAVCIAGNLARASKAR